MGNVADKSLAKVVSLSEGITKRDFLSLASEGKIRGSDRIDGIIRERVTLLKKTRKNAKFSPGVKSQLLMI